MIKTLLKNVYYQVVGKNLIYLPKPLAHKIIYYMSFRKNLDLNNPVDINQKIHYLVVYRFGEFEARMLNKHMVKEYINSLGIKDLHVARLYALYDDVNKIDLSSLPNKFVMKTTHGCGDYVICLDKNTFDLKSAKQKLDKALKKSLSRLYCEYFSINVPKAIICEEYINDGINIAPIDYKLWCFHGKVMSIMVCTERCMKTKFDFYDTEWNYLDWNLDELRSKKTIPKPENLKRLVEVAEELAKPFPFVRVDLYCVNGIIFFGEFTFTPCACNIAVQQPILKVMGDMLDLNKYP